MLSKTFDNGMICASEQAVIVDKEIAKDFERIMKDNNCYFLNKEETEKVSNYVINPEKQAVNPVIVGKPAAWIAEQAGVKVPDKTKILIAKLPKVGPEYPLSRENSPLCSLTLLWTAPSRASSMPTICLKWAASATPLLSTAQTRKLSRLTARRCASAV